LARFARIGIGRVGKSTLDKPTQGSEKMPRLAILLSGVLCALLVPAMQAEPPARLRAFDDEVPLRVPAPPQNRADDDSGNADSAVQPQATPNQELTVRHHSPPSDGLPSDEGDDALEPPTCDLLPVPPSPPKLDTAVTPADFQQDIPEKQAASAEDTPADKSSSTTQRMPLSPQYRPAKLPLAPSAKGDAATPGKSLSGLPSTISVAGSTGIVLGIFMILVWIVRRKTPQALIRLPGEAFEILGRAPLSGRQQVQLLRCGSRLLLVSVTPSGAETLTEITDPMEVDRLAGLCKQSQPGSSSAAFKQVFEQLAPRRPAKGGYIERGEESETAGARYYHSDRAWEDRDV
jgi:flagellar biogenesis protein FliO